MTPRAGPSPGRGVTCISDCNGLAAQALAQALALAAALALALGLALAASARTASFPDVDGGAWYAGWVDEASSAGLMTGYDKGPGAGLFGPEDHLTRAQAATVLWRMAGSPAPSAGAGFPDVEAGSWYADAVDWCAANGIVTGYEDGPDKGLFVPDGEVTRAELAAMAWRWAKWAGVDASCPDPSAFESTTDWRGVEGWATEALTWTAAAGVLSGADNPDGTRTLDPGSGATRAQAAKVFTVLAGRPSAPKASHAVSFESNGGSAVAPQGVACGQAASEPAAPSREGYAFGGWYADEGLTQAYDFSAPVTCDITLYARWNLRTYTVAFVANGGAEVPSQPVRYGGTADEPDPAPARLGYKLAGWYADEGLTQAYDFSAPVTCDITLYARWDAAPCAVLHSDGLLSLQVGPGETQGHGGVSAVWEWGGGSRPWTDDAYRSSATSVVATGGIELSGDCSDMFFYLANCQSMDLRGLDVSGVTSFETMFNDCLALESLDLTGWDVSKGTYFGGMFAHCSSLAGLDLSGWDVSSGTDFSGMFYDCSSLATLDLSGWDVDGSANLDNMFHGCDALSEVTLGAGCGGVAAAVDDAGLDGWRDALGNGYDALADAYAAATVLPATFGRGTRTVSFDLAGGEGVENQQVAYGETAAEPDPAPARLGYEFAGWYADEGLTQEHDFSAPVASDLTLYAKWDAAPCAVLHSDGLLSLQLGPGETQGHGGVSAVWEWDGSSRPWTDNAYHTSVTSVIAKDKIELSGDCTWMFSYFTSCQSMDLGKLDVSGVTGFRGMFEGCWSLESLDGISGWDVSKGEDFGAMFYCCRSLESLDLFGWRVADPANLMFYDCDSLSTVTLGAGCSPLVDQLGGPWYGEDGIGHASITADLLPGTFTKQSAGQAEGQALALASLDADAAPAADGADTAIGAGQDGEAAGAGQNPSSSQPAGSGQLAGDDQSASPEQPAGSDRPSDGDAPTSSNQPADGDAPADSNQPANPNQPEDGDQPADSRQPVDDAAAPGQPADSSTEEGAGDAGSELAEQPADEPTGSDGQPAGPGDAPAEPTADPEPAEGEESQDLAA